MLRKIKFFTLLFVATMIASCGHSQVMSTLPASGSESAIPASFALTSDFPADIVIPDVEGMSSTAFIVSTSTPAAVIAVDIDANPMKLSEKFKGVVCPQGTGIPARLFVSSEDEAFLLTSNSIISFDPVSGSIYDTEDALDTITVGIGPANSNGSSTGSTIEPKYPSGIVKVGERLFVSSGNFIRTDEPAIAAPGTIQVFSVSTSHVIARTGYIITSNYNPTGLAVRGDSELVVTNSGVIDIVDAKGVPSTDSSIDVVDVETLAIKYTIPLGEVAASYHPIALTYDGSRGFLGSVALGQVYEIDFMNRQVLRGRDNPIIVSSDGDYITDVKLTVDNSYLFAASFETSSVYPFDLSQTIYPKGDEFVVGFSAGATEDNPSGANTGAGPMAVRPGTRDVDYEGADLFVLTGYPGTLVAVRTDAPAVEFVPEEVESESLPPPPAPTGYVGTTCQAFAQAVHSISYGDGAGFGQSKFPNVVLGPPKGNGEMAQGVDVLSLGKFGEIILDLGNCKIVDGPGADFSVFENVFLIGGKPDAPFAELGAVAVSDDGIDFTEFECNGDALPYTGCAGWTPTYSNPTNGIDPFDPDVSGGEAFDLADIGIESARYVRIRDLKGIGGAGLAGFDLDAIAVINGEIN